MDATPVTLDPSEISDSGSEQSTASQPVTLDPSEISGGTGPINPYAQAKPQGDLANVPGALPWQQTPQQAAGAKPGAQPVVPVSTMGALTGAKAPATQSQLDAILRESPEQMAGEITAEHSAPQWHPVQGARQVIQGVKDLNESGALAPVPVSPSSVVPSIPKQKQDVDQAARGESNIISGGMEVQQPLVASAVLGAPIKMAIGYAAGVLAGNGAKAAAQASGASPDVQELVHTAAFFAPGLMAEWMGLRAGTGTTTARVPDSEGNVQEVPVKTVSAGGNGFGVGVGKGEDGSYYAAGRVGPFSARAKWGGAPEGKPAAPAEPAQLPAPPPDATTVQRQQQEAAIDTAAAKATAVRGAASAQAGMAPPPPPPPKPGEPGSKEFPAPAGMDQGALTKQTAENVGKLVQMAPPEAKPGVIISTVNALTKWVRGKGTIIGPDNKLSQVTGQSDDAKDQSARTIATKLVNDEVENQNQKQQQAIEEQKAQAEEAQKAAKEKAETALEEHEAAIDSMTEGGGKSGTKEGETAPTVQIPETPAVTKARTALQSMPGIPTSEDMEKRIRETATVTKPVRDALVMEERNRRANITEDAAETRMNGEPAAEGQDRQSIQAWADKVVAGEHPYVFVPKASSFKPAGVDDLTATKVNGAGAFSGTYYHSDELSPADIRRAARDKNDPQGHLDALERKWQSTREPVELHPEEVTEEKPLSQNSENAKDTSTPPTSVPDRRKDAATRKRIEDMSPEEMRKTLLTSEKTGLPNRRAFDDAQPSKAVAMSDADGLKALNDKFGYAAGDALLQAKADALREAGVEAYHDKGDEFLYRGESSEDLKAKLEQAREILRNREIEVETTDGKTLRFKGADFSYGTGKDLSEAETGLKEHKSDREARGERARGELRGIAEVGSKEGEEREGAPEEPQTKVSTTAELREASDVTLVEARQKWAKAVVAAGGEDSAAGKMLEMIEKEQNRRAEEARAAAVREMSGGTASTEFKPGEKVTVTNPDGSTREDTVRFKTPGGKYVLKGQRKPVAAESLAKPAAQEENDTNGAGSAHPAGIDQTGGGRSSSDSGSGDRGDLESAPSKVREAAGGDRTDAGTGEGNSPAVRDGSASVPEQGAEPGSGKGSDTALDNAPGRPVADEAKKKAAKPVTLNRDWYSHPDNWQPPRGDVTRMEGNLAALRILRDVEKSPRKLTDEELNTLANYVGWGALSNAFDPYRSKYDEQDKWRRAYVELQKLLSPQEFEAARRSTTNAHYTSPEIVRWMWEIAQRFGFKGGNVIEPSMGSGNFFGMMPKSIRGKVAAVGNEMDPVTYGIAKLLYPSAQLFNKDFKDLIIPDNDQDLAIGNVPFGEWTIHDPKYKHLKAQIHDYFMVKSLDKVKPGGVVMYITSTGTMDKPSSTVRDILASKANLVGAFRLPSGAFKASAGTDVTTDLIILQKRAPGEAPAGEAWTHSEAMSVPKDDKSGDRHELNVNEYYHLHPTHMLGEPVASTKMYGSLNFALNPHENADMPALLQGALKDLPKGIMLEGHATGLDLASTDSQYASDNVLERQYVLDDKGNLKQRVDGKLVIPSIVEDKDGTINRSKVERMKAMVGVREKLNDLLSDMVTMPDNEEANSQINTKREALKKTYDQFVKKYGLLNSPTNRIFQDDPHFPRLLALEHYDRAKRTATPADIFRQRTIFPREPLKAVSNDPKEALQQVLAERGFPDVNLIARLQGKEPKEVAKALTEQGLIFRDPEIGDYQTREKYLSGYVRDKLRTAQTAVAQGMKEYEPNVKALEGVIPADIEIGDDPATSVSVRPGATWIPLDAIHDFFENTFRTPAKIRYMNGQWSVELKGRATPEITNTFGTTRVYGNDLFQDALNLRQTMVYDNHADGSRTLNQKETTLAQATQERIRQEFQKWAAHSDWTKRLTRAYNDACNNLASTEYDGSHLKFPGMNSSIILKPHQSNAVWRILQDGRGLLAHEVGAGKTFEMAAAIMEGRRVGTFKKPMLTVPNHIVEQFRKEFLLLYPGASLLVPSETDFDARNRQRIMSHIATGDYDAVILPHSQFNLMDISPERQEMTLQRQMDELEETIRALKASKGETRTIKQLEKAKEKLRTRMAQLRDLRADRAINFDDLGVDALFVDEAHLFKNLPFYTKMTRVAGIQQSAAKSALRLKMKTEFLQDTYNGRGVVFATGTPVQNTMAELYTMMKYVAPDVLERAGIRFFDDWAANFGSTITAMELSADGRSYKARTKFARFQNVPELMQMFRSFADIKTAADLDLPRPDMETGKPIVVTVPGTPELEEFVKDLMRRAERVRGGGVDPKSDNMLKITTDGRKAATDMRLIDTEYGDNPNSKINVVVRNMVREWEEGKEEKLTQMAFLDLYRSIDDNDKETINLYNDMRDKLVAAGIPKDQIAVIGEHDTRIKRQVLFDKVNKGDVRILLGSTQKMGAGTNAQKRLKTLHHVDLTWRPGDLQQRDGRILRQGNLNKEVRIQPYLTEKSFDAYMAQTLQGKAEFISQLFSGRSKARVMVDAAADMVLSLEEMKIAASGNPDVKLKYDLEMQIAQLRAIERGFENQKRDAQYNAERAQLKQTDAKTRIETYTRALEKVKAVEGDGEEKGFSLDVDGKKFTDRKEAFEYLKAMEVPKQNFWLTVKGIGASVDVVKDDGKETFAYRLEYGGNDWPPQRTMESLVSSIEAKLRNLPYIVEKAQTDLTNAKADEANFKNLAERTDFPEKKQLDETTAKLAEVEKRLGLGNVNEGSQADGDAVAADAEAETPDKEPAEIEEKEPSEEDENGGSVWDALGSEEGSAVVPKVFEKAGEYLGKAAANTVKDIISATGSAAKTAKAAGREVVAALYPRALMDEDMKDILGRGIGKPAYTLFKAGHLMDGLDKMFDKMPESEQVEFIDRWQRGLDQKTQALQDAQELMQSIIDGQEREEEVAANLGRTKSQRIELPRRENYFPNRYASMPGGEKEPDMMERIAKMAQSRRPLEGSKKFMKQQKMTMGEAVEKGYKPLGNPVKILMRRLQEGSKYVAARYIMHEGKESGLALFVKGKAPAPMGYADVPDKMMKVFRPVELEDGGVLHKETGRWVWQEDFARGLSNYLSKDYVHDSKFWGALAKIKTASTEAKLSWSPFHWFYITGENFASGLNVGLDKLYNQGVRGLDGDAALEGLADIGKTMFAPYSAVKVGGQMLRWAKNPEEYLETPEGKKLAEMFPDLPHIFEMAHAGGLRWGMPDATRESLGEGFVKEIASGHLGKATLKFFPWLSHLVMKPLFEQYVPRSKWFFFAKMFTAKCAQYSDAIAEGKVTEEQLAREVADAAENRFGEMNFDNFYWHNTLRAGSQIMFRSVSWKAGTWRGLAKAGQETVNALRDSVHATTGKWSSSAFDDNAYEKVAEDAEKRVGGIRDFTGKLPRLGTNTGWLISMGMVLAVGSTVLVKLLTGKYPSEYAQEDHKKLGLPYLGALALESLHPRTGGFDPHGEPIRMSFPTGLKDYEHAYYNPAGYAHGAASDILGSSLDTMQNRDAFGNYVWDPNAPEWKKFEQGLLYNGKQTFLPISVTNWADSWGPQDTETKLMRASGLVGGSPKELERSKALSLALSLRGPHAPETPEQEDAYRMTREHPTTVAEAQKALKEKRMDYLERVFKQLKYSDAKRVYEAATPEEKKELFQMWRTKQLHHVSQALANR